jgi:hypothetical protein
MANWRTMVGKRSTMNKEDVKEEQTVTIRDCILTSLTSDDDEIARDKLTLQFEEHDRSMVMNVTNGCIIEAMFGAETDDWIGHGITLGYDDSVQFKGRKVGGIRVVGSPDLDGDKRITIVPNTKKKPVTMTLRKTTPAGVSVLLMALRDAGLTRDQYDQWAQSIGRPVFSALTNEQAEKMGAYIAVKGAAAVRTALGLDAPTTAPRRRTGGQ